jgi:hypothetical protein
MTSGSTQPSERTMQSRRWSCTFPTPSSLCSHSRSTSHVAFRRDFAIYVERRKLSRFWKYAKSPFVDASDNLGKPRSPADCALSNVPKLAPNFGWDRR